MKFISNNITLNIAITISVLAHATLLAVHFTAPDAFRFKPTDPGLEVVLVNAKHDRKPVKADALAQANLDGGGNADAGRATSPLPEMGKVEDGDSMAVAKKRIMEWEERQQKMLAQINKKTKLATPLVTSLDKPREAQLQPDGNDVLDSAKAIRRMEAEIAKRIEDENKRPKKTFISPSTREVGYAMYYATVRERIEKFGTLNFPQKNGRKLYGELILSMSIFQDGKIYEGDGDGGIVVELSSGNPDLDAAAKRIIRRAAPFGKFADNMRSAEKNDVWVMTTRFKFTNEDFTAELRGAKD
ncbi:MAG: energy transducer TonB [Burkholderiaceae bacterium]